MAKNSMPFWLLFSTLWHFLATFGQCLDLIKNPKLLGLILLNEDYFQSLRDQVRKNYLASAFFWYNNSAVPTDFEERFGGTQWYILLKVS